MDTKVAIYQILHRVQPFPEITCSAFPYRRRKLNKGSWPDLSLTAISELAIRVATRTSWGKKPFLIYCQLRITPRSSINTLIPSTILSQYWNIDHTIHDKLWVLAPGWQSRHHLRFQAMPSIQIHDTYSITTLYYPNWVLNGSSEMSLSSAVCLKKYVQNLKFGEKLQKIVSFNS